MAVPVRTFPDFSMGAAIRLFAHAGLNTSRWDPNYDVTADGARFLIPERVEAQGSEQMIRVVENWFAEFRDRQH